MDYSLKKKILSYLILSYLNINMYIYIVHNTQLLYQNNYLLLNQICTLNMYIKYSMYTAFALL